jgi:hypothetical protein
MTIANNPKNQTSHAAQGSGQIIAGREPQEDEEICFLCDAVITEGMAYEGNRHICMDCAEGEGKPYPAWVVVDKAGTDEESIVIDFYTPEAAFAYKADMADEFDALDIMKRLPDGTLTTEF